MASRNGPAASVAAISGTTSIATLSGNYQKKDTNNSPPSRQRLKKKIGGQKDQSGCPRAASC